jgi:hypothetical protein
MCCTHCRLWGTIYFLLIIACFSQLFSQDVQITATVNKNKVALNETFEYKIEISGNKSNLPSPQFPSFDAFNVLSGPNTASSYQFINGKMSSSKSFSYYLQPQNLGEFTIPAATIEVDGEVISSNEIKMTVTKANAAQKKARQQTPGSRQDAEISGEDLFLKADIEKTSVYQNEQILVTYKLYFRVNVNSYNIEKIPANPGFWTEEFKIASQPTVSKETINGIAYNVATLRKVALFPTRSGELTIEPLTISADARVKTKRRTRSLFDSFFDDPFGRTVRKTLTTRAKKVTVKPIPKSNRPADFNGAVGRFTLNMQVDKEELTVNEAASIKLTISGEGNIKLLKPPVLSLPPDIQVYDPTEKTNIKRENNKVSGNKIVEYVVFPRFEGAYTIKPLTLSYFNPKNGKFARLTSSPITLTVLPGTSLTGSMVSGSNLNRQEVALLGEDIRFIKQTARFFKAGDKIYRSWLYLSIYLLPLIGLIMAWNFAKQREKIRSDLQLAKRRKAGRIAAKHLAEAKRSLKSSLQGEFYRKMSQALQGFVSDRLNIQMTDFNAMTVKKNLESAGLGVDEIQEYQSCLEESDYRQFAGGESDIIEMKNFFERAKNILTRLEKYI